MTLTHLLTIIIILILAILAAFFSGSETALTSTSDAKVHILIKQGVKKAKTVKALRENFSAISTILITNQIINNAISMILSWLIIDFFGEGNLPILGLITTLILITYTEILPKMIAISYPENFILLMSKFISIIIVCLRPFVELLEYVADVTLKLFRVKHESNMSKKISDEEVRGIIDIHSAQNNSKHEKIMLNGILDLNELEISQIETPRGKIFKLNASLPLDRINEELLHCKYTRVPIWDQNPENIIGILHSKVFFKTYDRNKKFDIRSICLKPWFVPETTKVIKQLQEFKQRREHFSIVVDEYGSLTGIITLEDILEEIVGEILDEHDDTSQQIIEKEDGIIVDASIPVRDINRRFEYDIPEDEASTIGGFIVYKERKIPKKGDIVSITNDLSAEILKRKRNMILTVKLIKKNN